MANTRVAERYAEALLGLTEDKEIIDRVAGDLEILQGTVKESKEFLLFLKSPVINKEKKKEILSSLFSKRLHEATMGFVSFLVEKGREDLIPLIVDRFLSLRDEKRGIVAVDVRSASKFDEQQDAELRKRFEGYTRKKVKISYATDELVRGGFVARIGDTVFDGSIRRQLELLKERFAREQSQK